MARLISQLKSQIKSRSKYLSTRWRGFLRKDQVEDELEAELRFHIIMRTRENLSRGMALDQASHNARLRFGNFYYFKDLCREISGGGMIDTLWQDLRFGLRQLFKAPGFTTIAILSLALGIGANTAIFSLVSLILLRPLPITQPERVVSIYPTNKNKTADNGGLWSYPNYRDLRDKNEVMSGMAVHRFAAMSLSHDGANERIWGYLVSENYFDVLGVNAVQGRTFMPDEYQTVNSHPVAVMSYGCWQRRFGSDPQIVGKTILLNGHSFTVIGIAPEGFIGTELMFLPEFWVPSAMQTWIEPGSNGLEGRNNGQWWAFGRLKPGIGRMTAEAQLSTITAQLSQEYPHDNVNEGSSVQLTTPGLVFPGFRDPTIAFTGVLMLTVALVLLIACTNLANLLLARATQRRKEIAVRLALGASRLRLIRQLLTESILLSVLGGIAGLVLGLWLMELVKGMRLPIDFSLAIDLRLDWRVFGFVVMLAGVTGIGFGLIPALQATKPDVVLALKDETASIRGRRIFLRHGLVITQVAISLVLLIAAGLVVRSLQHVQMVGPGFDSEHALTMSVDVGLQGYDKDRGQQFYRQLIIGVKTLPGVQSAALVSILPLNLDISGTGVAPEGDTPKRGSDLTPALYCNIGPDYFAAMGIPLVAGRDFSEQDKSGSTHVAIINETFARRFWPGQQVVGKRFKSGMGNAPLVEIVGVAKDGKYFSLGEDPRLFVYFPLAQSYSSSASLVVRTTQDPSAAITSVRNEVRKLDANLPIFDVKTLTELMKVSLLPMRAGAAVIGSFGLLALALAALGIYGVMSYSVSQRTRELGIRMALGASASTVLRMVVTQGLKVTLIGIVLGLCASVALGQVVAQLLYGVSATDPITFLAISLLLAMVAFAACYIPARRAARVDPLIAIRNQ